MWFKANQKGYRCGGNIKHGDTFWENRVVIREKELEHIIIEDLQELFQSIQDDEFLKSLQKRLDQKKFQINNELKKIEKKSNKLRSRKKDYLDMYADEIITREELVEYRKQIDQEVSNLETAKIQYQEKLEECESENYAIHLGKKLKEVSILNDLTPQDLHSLVNKVTCSIDGNLRIHYNFVNPFEEQE
ncbi:hypothetical protein CHI10_11475 [Bacillus sp. 7894-2]|nr:hypothetical protein CHI10_11475 [Bacillus sp. 7894-2]